MPPLEAPYPGGLAVFGTFISPVQMLLPAYGRISVGQFQIRPRTSFTGVWRKLGAAHRSSRFPDVAPSGGPVPRWVRRTWVPTYRSGQSAIKTGIWFLSPDSCLTRKPRYPQGILTPHDLPTHGLADCLCEGFKACSSPGVEETYSVTRATRPDLPSTSGLVLKA